jgi:hypothetical protein
LPSKREKIKRGAKNKSGGIHTNKNACCASAKNKKGRKKNKTCSALREKQKKGAQKIRVAEATPIRTLAVQAQKIKRGAKNKSPKAKNHHQNHPEQTPSTSPEKQNRWGLGRKEGETGGKASYTRVYGQNAHC